MVTHVHPGMMLMNLKDKVAVMVTLMMMILMLQLNAVFVVADLLVVEMQMLLQVITLNLLL